MLEESLVDTYKVLATKPTVHENVRQTIRGFTDILCNRLGIESMPTNTHLSINSSGSEEFSAREGGGGEEILSWISELDVPLSSIRIGNEKVFDYLVRMDEEEGIDETLFDPFGQQILNPDQCSMGAMRAPFVLYNSMGIRVGANKAGKILKQKLYPKSIGKVILLMALIKSLDYGHFDVPPDGYLSIGLVQVPFWHKSDRPIRYIVDKASPCVLTVLAEPGAKCRSLTKNSSWLVTLLKVMRFQIEPVVARDGRARIGLASTNKM